MIDPELICLTFERLGHEHPDIGLEDLIERVAGECGCEVPDVVDVLFTKEAV